LIYGNILVSDAIYSDVLCIFALNNFIVIFLVLLKIYEIFHLTKFYFFCFCFLWILKNNITLQHYITRLNNIPAMNEEIKKLKEIHICDLILEKLYQNTSKHSIAWLAREIEHEDSSLCKLLRNSYSINTKLLFPISIALKYDFFACFSEILSNFSVKKPQTMLDDKPQICVVIHEELRQSRHSISWLGLEINPYRHRSVFGRQIKKDRDSIDTSLLLNISIIMKRDFFYCFSEILRKYLLMQNSPHNDAKFVT
jgi:hypothetical protein